MKITKDKIIRTWDETMDVLHEYHPALYEDVADAVWQYSRFIIHAIGRHLSQFFREGESNKVDINVTAFDWGDHGYSHYLCDKSECEERDNLIDSRYQPGEDDLLKLSRETVGHNKIRELLAKRQECNND